jgi:hypothetical protein
MYPSTQLEIIKAVDKNGSTIAKLKSWSSIKGLVLKGYDVHEISLKGLSGYYLIKKK